MMRFFLLLLTVGTVMAQRTPFYVNGNVVSSPNLRNTAFVLYSVSGSNVDAVVTNVLDITELNINIGYITNDLTVAANAYISNLHALNAEITNNLSVYGNTYVSNFYALNTYVTNTLVSYNNTYLSNLFVTDVDITNNITIRGNATINNLVVTNNTYVSNLFFTNLIGTIDATGSDVTLKQRKSLKLQYPRKIDGAGCTYSNTNDYTAELFMVPRFDATGATNANYAEWAFRVPSDIDTASDMTASLTVQLAGADTDAATYTVGVVSIANSSAGAGTPANYVTLTIPADGSGGSGDIESVNSVTLTGWAAALTANQWALVRLQRDGSDASAVAQDALELEIFYVSSQ